jgi:hypothetical protein
MWPVENDLSPPKGQSVASISSPCQPNTVVLPSALYFPSRMLVCATDPAFRQFSVDGEVLENRPFEVVAITR